MQCRVRADTKPSCTAALATVPVVAKVSFVYGWPMHETNNPRANNSPFQFGVRKDGRLIGTRFLPMCVCVCVCVCVHVYVCVCVVHVCGVCVCVCVLSGHFVYCTSNR